MIRAYERQIAWRYLRPRKGEGFIFLVAGLALFAIAIGVWALVTVMSVMGGFRAELLDRILGVNGHAVVQGYDGRLENWQTLLTQVRQTPGVVRATPLIESQLMASHQGRAAGVIVRGALPDDLRSTSIIATNVLAGALADFRTGEPVVALGSRLASQLLVRVGDTVTLISPDGQITPFGSTPRIATFTVVAIFEVGIFDYDNAFVFLPMDTAQTFFRMGEAVGAIEIVSENPDRIDTVTTPLLPQVRPFGVIVDWRAVNRELFEALEIERVMTFWVLTLIVVVGAFNIISSVVMLVRTKARDIAILRTMGTDRGSILRIFMGVGMTIGVLGTALGTLFGVLTVHYRQGIQNIISALSGTNVWDPKVRFLTEVPARLDGTEVAGIAIVSLVLVFLFSFFPSWTAANTDPVKVLRYD
jgi:lipoprotein-releasing system permease protein